ncbi:MAG TPA: VOC family protein [Thermomicrobiales bacterium]|nr:VOC family protein [Thermomicrobiales bacterium]
MPDISSPTSDSQRPTITFRGAVLNSPDPATSARFYADLLGWTVTDTDAEWADLAPPAGGPTISFHIESIYERPTWPAEPGKQQMMQHLDFQVQDLDAAVAHAVSLGAAIADDSRDRIRVMRDPDGHIFCLFTG